MSKIDEYQELVAHRKECRRCSAPEWSAPGCSGLMNPAAVDGGRCDEIGPWSLWQGNLDSELMVVGQDWGDVNYFARNGGKEVPGNPTNVALAELIGSLGISIGPPGDAAGQNVLFFTNAILCLKKGGLQGKVYRDWFENCGEYLRRQIEIVQPKVVVGLGERAFRSILAAFNRKPRRFRTEVEDAEGTLLPNGSRVFAVYHCGRRIQNTHRNLAVQKGDWARLRPFIAAASATDSTGRCSQQATARRQ